MLPLWRATGEISLMTLQFYHEIPHHKKKTHTNKRQEKNTLMVLLYSVLANSSGSSSLTAAIISNIWLKQNTKNQLSKNILF